jgi:hypothetical protein
LGRQATAADERKLETKSRRETPLPKSMNISIPDRQILDGIYHKRR